MLGMKSTYPQTQIAWSIDLFESCLEESIEKIQKMVDWLAQGRAPFLPREARALESERMPADPKAAFDKKVALQKSSGVMPKVPKSLSEADLKLLYYTTSTQNSYQTKAIPESMSFADIHNIGKKDTKYFKYKPSTAPFWQRSMCRYASDYVDRAVRMTQGDFYRFYITFPVYFS